MNVDQTKKIISDFSYYRRDKLGSGSSSEVFRGISIKTTQPVAVKVIPLSQSTRELLDDTGCPQIELLKKLKDSEHIIQIKSAIQTKNNLYIVTELCVDGTLEAQLAHSRRLDQEAAVNVMEQILAGCREMIREGIVHRDLKPSNILRKGNTYKIGDFGYALTVEQCEKPQKENVGSPSYMPLQSLQLNNYNHQSDIWALGVIFFQMLTGKTPWKARTEKELVRQIKKLQFHSILPKLISATSKKFLQRALVVQAAQRMTTKQLMMWNFRQNHQQESQAASSTRLKAHLQRPLRSTYDLHQLQDFKTILQSKSYANLNLKSSLETPKNESAVETERGNLNFNKIKRNQSFAEFSKKNELATTMHTITSSKQKNSPSNDFSNTASDLSKKVANIANPKEAAKTIRDKPEHYGSLISQVQAQVDYSRFLLRVLRKLNDYLRTKDTRVLQLKQSLLYFLYIKLTQIKDLRFAKASAVQKQKFIASSYYASVLTTIGKFRERAKDEGTKIGAGVAIRTEKQFINTLSNAMGLLYSNVAPLRDNPQELQRKKAIVFILEDLVALSEIFILEREQHWLKFSDSSAISSHIARTSSDSITLPYFRAVEAKFIKLAQS